MTKLAGYGFGAGAGTTITDDSGNGHTLTISTASWEPSGHTGPGLSNTATNSIGASGTVPAVTTVASLMCWVKPLLLTAGATCFVCGAVESGGNTDFALYTQRGNFGTPNVLQADVRIGGLVQCAGAAMTVGTWTHIAVTFDGFNIRLYTNGVLTTTVANTGTINNATGFYVAGAPASNLSGTQVVVDDVRYYDQVLTVTDIATLMATPEGPAGHTTALGRATETDTAAAVVRKKNTALLRATETDTAAALGRAKASALGCAAELGTVAALVRSKALTMARAGEVDTGAAIGRAKLGALGRAIETDTAAGVQRGTAFALGRAVETSSVSTLVRSRSLAVSRAVEVDTCALGASAVLVALEPWLTIQSNGATLTVAENLATATIDTGGTT